MYLEHYGLSEAPFRITPNTDFFFAGANRGATLDALIYAITHDEGIVKISGEVGSGKTMLCRVLMERLPPDVVTVYLANPSLSREDILFALADELGVETGKGRATAVLRRLQEHLIGLHGNGQQVVILIDEAHAMPIETLEEIRLLSNLETNHHMLLQLVLFGQPELNEILSRPNMRQLKERITHNFALEPMVRNDIDGYIDFRMRAAGYHGPKIFSDSSVKLITGASLGLTRRINIIADKSLLAAFAENTHQISPRHIHAAIRDAEFGDFRPPRTRLWAGLAATVLVVLAFLVFIYKSLQPAPANAPVSSAADTPVASEKPAAAIQPVKKAALAPAAVAPNAPPPSAIATTRPNLTASLKQTIPAKPSVADATPLVNPATKLGEQARLRLEATQLWLKATPDDRWFIQLLGSDLGQASAIEDFVVRSIELLGADQVRVYVANSRGVQRVGVIYGEYPSREAAINAIKQLPVAIRGLSPFPRMVKHLR
ncbi:MAG: AAA family ATPase [Proteobacteria bacterium]|nr:AAA family ATPase [Pseudomonadota bacterium]